MSKGSRSILFYKPYGVLCQFSDRSDHPRPTLKDFIPIKRVYPVGRLDLDSEGLLLLTDNSRIKHRLSEPKFAHPRTYWVQVEGIPTDQALDRLRQGVTIKNYRTRPAQVTRLATPALPPRNPPIRFRQSIPTDWLAITLTEGRNRQVRRMSAAVGYPTLRLVRAKIGLNGKNADLFNLEGLTPGQWRELSPQEIQALQKL